jgi:DNA modification methylase
MDLFKIYNHTSENMSETADSSVDIVIFAPPYNINTPYNSEVDDSKKFNDFKNFLSRVIAESARVLKPGGIFFCEAADSVYFDKKFVALSDLIQKIATGKGLSVWRRDINFLQSESGLVLTDKEHNWSTDYYSTEDAHSNCHQWLTFKKGPCNFDSKPGRVYYVNYPNDEEGHPCPFSYEHIQIFLEITGFEKNMTLLEPFMGIARMGEEVIKRGGKYIGYELAKKYFDTARKRLENI